MKSSLKYLFISILLLIAGLYGYMLTMKPSNNRNWESGFEKMPEITTNGSLVKFAGLKNTEYDLDKVVN